jgi:hypothetical protein
MKSLNRREFLRLAGVSAAATVFSGGGCGKEDLPRKSDIFEGTKPTDLKVLVIGIDGATLDIVKPLIAAGKLPAFKRLINGGTCAKLRSQPPMLSPSLWTTIATGHNRDRHNITNFFPREQGNTQARTLVTTEDRKALALWNIVSEFKKTVGVCGWWVTWPAESILGNVASDRIAHGRWRIWTNGPADRNLTFPPQMFNNIWRLVVDPANPPMDEIAELVELTPTEKTEMLGAKKPIVAHGLSVFKFGYCAQRTYEKIALYMLERGQHDLNMVFLICVDPICHTFWHYYRPEQFTESVDPGKAARLGRLVTAMYEHNDRYITKLLSKIDRNTVIIVVSDHGFQASGQLPQKTSEVDYRFLGINRIERLNQSVSVGMSGIHHIDGMFIASGAPIIQGATFKTQPSIIDIAPTVLALMGLPVGKDMAGRVLEEIIDPNFIKDHPIRYIDSYEKYIDRISIRTAEKVAEDEMLEYLRSLGYVR